MFNLSFKKKLKKILLPINKIIESYFAEIDRSKSQSIRQTPIKKKISQLDGRIESFFDKFKNFKKFNQNKKKFSKFNSKIAISIACVVILFLSYFLLSFLQDLLWHTFHKYLLFVSYLKCHLDT